MRKNEVREPFREKHEKTANFNDESMRTKEAPEAYRSMLPSKYDVLAGHDIPCFWVLKNHGKSIKSGTFGARGPDFPDFGRIFERSDFIRFWMIFDEFSIGKKSTKNPTLGIRRAAKGRVTGRVGG